MGETKIMTSRERIIAALEHREPDRLPIDFAGTDCSSIHVIAYDKLRKHLGIESHPMRLACLMQMIAEGETELQDYFNADAKALYFYPRKWRMWESGWGFDIETPDLWRPGTLEDGKTVVRAPSGKIQVERPEGGYYFDPVFFVFSKIQSVNEFDNYPEVFARWDWPAVDDELVEEYAARAKELYNSTDRAVVASW